MDVISHKNVFINSETFQSGDGQNLTLTFPTDSFCTRGPDEVLRLTLNSFSMRRTFFAINKHNNKFYFGDGTTASKTFTIPEGDYSTLESLKDAIHTLVNASTFATATLVNNKLVITLASSNASQEFFYSDATMDTHEILGGYAGALFTSSSSDTIFTGKMPMQLDTISDVYLKTNLMSNNFISDKITHHMQNSDIFAKIPLYDGHSGLAEIRTVKWEDPNDLYSIYLHTSHLSNITFHICDDKSRVLPVSAEQLAANNLNFKMVFKFEVLKKRTPTQNQHSGFVQRQMDRADLFKGL